MAYITGRDSRQPDRNPEQGGRLGVVDDVERWLEARYLRNRLDHEYMEDEDDAQFSEALNLAKEHTAILIETYNRVRSFDGIWIENVEKKLLPGSLGLEN